MDASHDVAVLLAVKDAEVNMLRQQLATLSGDFNRNLAILSTKDAEADELRAALEGLSALIAEKDAVFGQIQEQVAELDALRQKETAERQSLEAALAAQKLEWQRQLQQEQSDRESLHQQLKQAEELFSSQVAKARQAAVNESVQRSTHHQAALERSADKEKQLQQQIEALKANIATKDSEMAAISAQMAAALESNKKIQENHKKAMAAKTEMQTQLQQQLEQLIASAAQANKEHELNTTKLTSSLHQMQQAYHAQTAEVQGYASAQKHYQEEVRSMQRQLKQQQQAYSKSEMRRSALDAALQLEVTARAGDKARLGMFQDRLRYFLDDLQQQCTRAQACCSSLSTGLVQTQHQLELALVQSGPDSPPCKAQLAQTLEAECLRMQRDLQLAQERTTCLKTTLERLHSQLLPTLTVSVGQNTAGPVTEIMEASTSAAAATAAGAAPEQALATNHAQGQHACQHSSLRAVAGGLGQQQEPAQLLAPAAAARSSSQATFTAPSCPPVADSDLFQYQSQVSCPSPAAASACAQRQRLTVEPQFAAATPATARQQLLQGWDGLPLGPMQHLHRHTVSASAVADSASLSGIVGELQEGVAQLQQQLVIRRQQLRHQGSGDEASGMFGKSRHMLMSNQQASSPARQGVQGCCHAAKQWHHTYRTQHDLQQQSQHEESQQQPHQQTTQQQQVAAQHAAQDALQHLLDQNGLLGPERFTFRPQHTALSCSPQRKQHARMWQTGPDAPAAAGSSDSAAGNGVSGAAPAVRMHSQCCCHECDAPDNGFSICSTAGCHTWRGDASDFDSAAEVRTTSAVVLPDVAIKSPHKTAQQLQGLVTAHRTPTSAASLAAMAAAALEKLEKLSNSEGLQWQCAQLARDCS